MSWESFMILSSVFCAAAMESKPWKLFFAVVYLVSAVATFNARQP